MNPIASLRFFFKLIDILYPKVTLDSVDNTVYETNDKKKIIEHVEINVKLRMIIGYEKVNIRSEEA